MARLLIATGGFGIGSVRRMSAVLRDYLRHMHAFVEAGFEEAANVAEFERLMGVVVGPEGLVDLDLRGKRLLLEVDDRIVGELERVLALFAAVGVEARATMLSEGDEGMRRYQLRSGRLEMQDGRFVRSKRPTS